MYSVFVTFTLRSGKPVISAFAYPFPIVDRFTNAVMFLGAFILPNPAVAFCLLCIVLLKLNEYTFPPAVSGIDVCANSSYATFPSSPNQNRYTVPPVKACPDVGCFTVTDIVTSVSNGNVVGDISTIVPFVSVPPIVIVLLSAAIDPYVPQFTPTLSSPPLRLIFGVTFTHHVDVPSNHTISAGN